MARVPGLPTLRREIQEAVRDGRIPASEGRDLASELDGFASDGRLSQEERDAIRFEIGGPTSGGPLDGDGSGGADGPGGSPDPIDFRGDRPPFPPPPGYEWDWKQGQWLLIEIGSREEEEKNSRREEERELQIQQQRTSARGILENLFSQLGFTDADRAALMQSVDSWIAEGLADVGTDAIMVRFRDTDVYKNRFQGMAALRERGQAITEAEYVQMERSYRRVLSSYNLPPEFYDNYDDYAKFIAADVSAQELEDRVVAARQVLDNANSMVLDELREYYNVDDGTALSYLLGLTDANGVARQSVRSQQEIRTGLRAAQVGGAAERAGFSMGRTQSELLASSTVGQTLDPFNPQTSAQLEATFNRARRTANRERTLAGIDQEGYSEMDTLSAAFGDDQAQLASERRARRERARFSGTAGAARSALSQSRNF